MKSSCSLGSGLWGWEQLMKAPKLCLTRSVRLDQREIASLHLRYTTKKMMVGLPVLPALPQAFAECPTYAALCVESGDSVTSSGMPALLSCHSGLEPNLCWQREDTENIILCLGWRDTS